MKPIRLPIRILLAVATFSALGTALGDPPIPIGAEAAFDAVQMARDPETGAHANVLLVDIRDPVEYVFNGAAAAVTGIHLRDTRTATIAPKLGKVRLVYEGRFLEYISRGHYRWMPVAKVASLDTEPLAYNIPFWRWTASGWDKSGESAFYDAIDALPGSHDVLILYCRTGGRSSAAGAGVDQRGLFWKVYEIDDPEGESGYGGFSGSAYGGAYNGLLGFAGRATQRQDHPSASWLDSGLPVTTAFKPIPAP